ncbi:MAG TPA: hypothetical protein VN026_03830 [Bacteroidia bacterium]|jgi:hypothetical protein|nr:hypothetical protein [Bacteroidia bacterium]
MSNQNIYRIFEVVSAVFELLPFVIVFIVIKKIKQYCIPLIVVVCLGIVTEVTNYICSNNGINNYFILRIYTIVELVLISLFYVLFFRKHFKSNFLFIPIPSFCVVAFIDYKINGINNFDNYAAAFEALTFSIFSLWSFFFISKNLIFEKITLEPFFWINTAVLFYFGGNLVLFIFNDYLIAHESSNHIALWAIHSVLNIFYNILIAIGFWKTKRQ